jgi:hypothetical protein
MQGDVGIEDRPIVLLRKSLDEGLQPGCVRGARQQPEGDGSGIALCG